MPNYAHVCNFFCFSSAIMQFRGLWLETKNYFRFVKTPAQNFIFLIKCNEMSEYIGTTHKTPRFGHLSDLLRIRIAKKHHIRPHILQRNVLRLHCVI